MGRKLWDAPVGGLELAVYEEVTDKPYHHPQVDVGCEDRYVVIGGGGTYRDGAGSMLTEMYPDPVDQTIWHAAAKDHLEDSEATLTAYCVAAKVDESQVYIAQATVAAQPPNEHRVFAWHPLGNNTWWGSSKDHLVEDPAVIEVSALGARAKTLECVSVPKPAICVRESSSTYVPIGRA